MRQNSSRLLFLPSPHTYQGSNSINNYFLNTPVLKAILSATGNKLHCKIHQREEGEANRSTLRGGCTDFGFLLLIICHNCRKQGEGPPCKSEEKKKRTTNSIHTFQIVYNIFVKIKHKHKQNKQYIKCQNKQYKQKLLTEGKIPFGLQVSVRARDSRESGLKRCLNVIISIKKGHI